MKIRPFGVRGATRAQRLNLLLDRVEIRIQQLRFGNSLVSATLPSGSLACSEKDKPFRGSLHLGERNQKGLQLGEQGLASTAFC